jgi:DNA replication protein DnaC
MNPIDLNRSYLDVLKLHGIKAILFDRVKHAREEQMGYEQFLNLILDDEVRYRKTARIARLIKNAGFRNAASCESVECSPKRNLDKKLLQELSTGRFIQESTNLLISGPTGVGKTFLATAIGNASCRNGFTTLFFRMNALLEKLLIVRAQGTYLNFLKKISAADLVILDDLGIKPLAPQQYQDLYDILDERGDQKSLIITTQLPITNWSEVIADPVTCEAITDRIVARSIQIQIKGDSYRKKIRKELTQTDPS